MVATDFSADKRSDESPEDLARSSGESFDRARWLVPFGLLLILAGQTLLLAHSASRHSPTWDEVGHLGAGLSHWEFGEFSQYAVNPPLVRTVAAMPVYFFLDPVLDWQDMSQVTRMRTEVHVGRRLINNNPDRFLWFFTVARWACVPFVWLGTVICFLWGRDLFGWRAGLLAAGTWAFSPMVLGHGALITPDVAAASLGLTSFYCLRGWLMTPSWSHVILMSTFFALALLAKSTWILSLAIVPCVWLSWRIVERFREEKTPWRWRRDLAHLCASVLLVFGMLNTFYGFEGTFTRLGDFEFVSTELAGRNVANRRVDFDNRFRDSMFASLPVPLPANFVRGMDIQKHDFHLATSGRGWPSYLFGTHRVGGWWYYYLAGYLTKEPLAWLLLLVLSFPLVMLTKLPGCSRWEGAALLIPSLIVLVAVSSQTNMSRHLRYAIPSLPFLFIWTSQFAVHLTKSTPKACGLVSLAALWFTTSSLYFAPHHLSYFNELVGGPSGGYRALNSSNIDWGQDLVHLRHWLDQHPEVDDMRLAYFGCFDPLRLGFRYELPAPYYAPSSRRHSMDRFGLQPGWYAVSVNYILGSTMPVPKGDGRFAYFGEPVYEYFERFEPVDRAGYSIWIYHLDHDEVARVRRELGIPASQRVAAK